MGILNEEQRKKYVELLKTNDIDKIKQFLMDSVEEGTLIYKYCRGLVRDFNTLKEEKIFLSNAYNFNDPFDCAYLVNKRSKRAYSEDERELAFHEYLEQEKADQESKRRTNATFVACFSERCDSSAMWGYYSADHKGMCIGYDLRELIDKFGIMPVIYSEDLPLLEDVEGEPLYISLVTKSDEWKHEMEWRIVKYDKGKEGAPGVKVEEILPKEIIIGSKEKETCKLNAISRKNNVKSDLLYCDVAQLIDWGRRIKSRNRIRIYSYDLSRSSYSMIKKEWKGIYT
ncbi:MAG: DUF2971 domain-containing protein [Lachnospiraceae bacterium]|nr:DUF2971 domain-containing protein [Lachnospiraceae bacterium]